MSYIKKIFDEFTTWKWSIFIIIILLYGWSIRVTFAANNLEQLPLNQWDIIFTFLSSPFLNIYFYLPFWLFFSSQLIIKEWDYTLLIRLKSFPKWIFHTISRLSPMLFIFQTFSVMISFLVAMGTPVENEWSVWGMTYSPLNNVVFVLQGTGLSPWIILLLQTALLSLFLVTLHVVTASIYVRFPRMNVIAGTSLFLFIGAIISYKIFPAVFVLGNVTNYSILSSAYSTFDSFLPSFILLILIITISLSLIVLWSKGFLQSLAIFLSDHYRFIIYISICLIGIFTQFTHPGLKVLYVWENLYFNFYGVSKDGFSLYIYLYFCIVFLGFVYLFQLHLSNLLNGHIYYLMIRYKSFYRWFFQLMKRTILSVISLLLFLAFATILVGLIQGRTLAFDTTESMTELFPYIFYHFFMNGFLQMLNYILIVFIVSWVWQEAMYSLIALGVLAVAGLPILNTNQWLPSGLNSMGYVTDDGTGVFSTSIVLLIYLLIEIGIIAYLFRKRKISF